MFQRHMSLTSTFKKLNQNQICREFEVIYLELISGILGIKGDVVKFNMQYWNAKYYYSFPWKCRKKLSLEFCQSWIQSIIINTSGLKQDKIAPKHNPMGTFTLQLFPEDLLGQKAAAFQDSSG